MPRPLQLPSEEPTSLVPLRQEPPRCGALSNRSPLSGPDSLLGRRCPPSPPLGLLKRLVGHGLLGGHLPPGGLSDLALLEWLSQLAGGYGVSLLAEPALLATQLSNEAASSGPSVLVIDDSDQLLDSPATSQLDRLVRTASDDERLVVIAGTTVDLLRRFSGWIFEARQSRSGMILQPASAAEGELLDLRLPRSTGSQTQTLPGRGILAVRGQWVIAQVLLPVAAT